MNRVFVDSHYYLALLNRDDQHHQRALEVASQLPTQLVTSHWVMLEVADGLASPPSRELAHRFLIEIESDPNTQVISTIEPWYCLGRQLYGRRADKRWSLTDCISFEIMKAMGLTDALTGDHHFVQAGFRALLA